MTDLKRDTEQPAGTSFFRVGKFALFSHRTCEQTRAHFGLSSRETELVLHIAGGLTKQEIAVQMGVSPATADTFRRRAYLKLGVNSAPAAAAIVSSYLAGTRVESREFEDIS